MEDYKELEDTLDKMDLEGFTFFFDDNDHAGGTSTPQRMIKSEYSLATRYLNFFDDDKSEWTVLISGGWIGVDVALFSRHVKKVVALEPVKLTYDKMVLNLFTNACYNVDSFELGFSDVNGPEDFNIISPSGSSGIPINYVSNPVIGNETCECIRWDTFMEEHDYDIDLCIIDIEGSEGRLVKSMTGYLPKRLLIAGYHPACQWYKFRDGLTAKGYKHLGHIMDGNKNVHSQCYELME